MFTNPTLVSSNQTESFSTTQQNDPCPKSSCAHGTLRLQAPKYFQTVLKFCRSQVIQKVEWPNFKCGPPIKILLTQSDKPTNRTSSVWFLPLQMISRNIRWNFVVLPTPSCNCRCSQHAANHKRKRSC
ncbi:hypothetical protein CEXT_427481 [Caerostris extrusa]|uniref:Uncharacterized protein n=1 Tax=Caerostris extrusa TaxID=172846 RepID=A0AAV4PYY0_CAEEX|nr:hypothetical protein CEXT_427481 [Caerostris extrusa]